MNDFGAAAIMRKPLPVFCSPHWCLPESERERQKQEWRSSTAPRCTGFTGKVTCEDMLHRKFRESQTRSWTLRLVDGWGLDDSILKNPDFLTFASYLMLWRLLQKGDATTGLLAQIASRRGTPLLTPEGKAEAGQHLAMVLAWTPWALATETRPNRTPVMSVQDTILAVMLTGQGASERWHWLTQRYGEDLHQAEHSHEFEAFIRRLEGIWTQISLAWPAAVAFGKTYFASGRLLETLKWDFCARLDTTWRRFHVALGFAWWDGIDELTPWCDVMPDVSDPL
jgi:hypothetical protein